MCVCATRIMNEYITDIICACVCVFEKLLRIVVHIRATSEDQNKTV